MPGLPETLVRQHQFGLDNPTYEWELADGRRISMGDALLHITATAVHRHLVPRGAVTSNEARK